MKLAAWLALPFIKQIKKERIVMSQAEQSAWDELLKASKTVVRVAVYQTQSVNALAAAVKKVEEARQAQ